MLYVFACALDSLRKYMWGPWLKQMTFMPNISHSIVVNVVITISDTFLWLR